MIEWVVNKYLDNVKAMSSCETFVNIRAFPPYSKK